MIVHKTQNIASGKLEKFRLLQRKLYCAAKAEPERSFGILYDKVCRADIIEEAWKRVRLNGGAPGVDGVTFDDIKAIGIAKYLNEIQTELQTGIYSPQPVRRKFIAKSNGSLRPLGIPTIKDRIVQMTVKIVIEPLFEADFTDNSYGFRPKRSAEQAAKEVRKYINYGCHKVVEVDLKSYFDNISHNSLMKLVQKKVSDPRVLKLLWGWLQVGIATDQGVEKPKKGTPQGGVISPLLANIFLNEVDKEWESRGYYLPSKSAILIRYADDMVILCKWNPELYFKILGEMLNKLNIEMNHDKTRITHASDGFDFLGIHFRLANTTRAKKNCYYWPSKKAVLNLKHEVRKIINHRKVVDVEKIIDEVNPILRGWGQYFKFTNAAGTFSMIDYFTRKRIYSVICKSRKLPSRYTGLSPKILHEDYGLVCLWKMSQEKSNAAR